MLKGGNPVYDCFPCQITTFGSVQADGSIDAVMNYQALKENGEVRKMVISLKKQLKTLIVKQHIKTITLEAISLV